MPTFYENSELDIELIKELNALAEKGDHAGYLKKLTEALSHVVIKENNEPIVPLTKENLHPKIYVRLVDLCIPTDEASRAFLRYTVVQKLNKAAESLPPDYSLIIRDALRTKRMINDLYHLYIQRLKKENPELPDKEYDLRIRNLLALPDDPVPPGHMTGGAVDVVLGNADGERVDVEVPPDQIPRKLQAPTFCQGIPPELVKRRQILYEAMTKQDFNNYLMEYWHFSYGDAYWAVRRISKVAIYGIVDPPKEK